MSEVEKTVLNNGIRIVSERMSNVHSVSMGIWANAGSRDERGAESGASHFVEHMIFKGTKRRSAFDIAREFDAVGGISNAFTSKEVTCFHAKVMDTHLDIMVDLLSDIFLNSIFDCKEIERERQVILQEIGMVEDSPDEQIHTLLSGVFWGSDHPLGQSVLGTADTVSDLKAEDIKRYLEKTYLPERIVIAAAGNIDHLQLVDMLASSFGNICLKARFPARVPPQTHSEVVAHPKDLEQVHVCIGTKGLSVTEPRRYAISLLNVILGGSMSSRLFQEVRERRGLAYSVFSFQSSYVDAGMLGIYAGTDRKSIDETVSVILEQIKLIKEVPVKEEELCAAKEHVKGGLYLAAESVDNRMNRLAQSELYFARYVSVEEVTRGFEDVTCGDIQEIGNDIFDEKWFSAVFLGPVQGKDKICREALRL